MLIFVPTTPTELSAWVTQPAEVTGFAATRAFLTAFGIASADAEETDLTLLEIAALAALLDSGRRLVAVCDADPQPGEPADLGAVRASAVPWRRVTSLFADDAEGAAVAAAARAELSTSDLAEAWDDPAVTRLIEGTDLLWHDASEWERLTH